MSFQIAVVYALTFAALLSALLCIGSHYRNNRRWFYFFKPATMVCLIVLALVVPPTDGLSAYQNWIIAGLGLSLLGDIMLMLPQDRFLAGLAAFLLAHWCYIAAFAGLPSSPNVLVLLPWLTVGVVLFALFKPQGTVLRIAVLAYIISILVMVWLAVENGRLSQTGWVAALAAVLFLSSDTLIGFRRFRRDWPSAQALILGSYFPAQWLFAVSPALM